MFGNAFKPRAHYVFDYKPRYYDERKERLEILKERYKNSNSDTADIPKISISKDQSKIRLEKAQKNVFQQSREQTTCYYYNCFSWNFSLFI